MAELETAKFELQEQVRELEERLEAAASPPEHEPTAEALRDEALRKKTEELERLQEQLARQAEQLREAEQQNEALDERTQQLDEANDERKDLQIKVHVLGEQLAELESLRERATALGAAEKELETLRQQLSDLTADNAQLRAKGVVLEAPPKPLLKARPENFGQSLQSILDRLSEAEYTRAAVVADELGLVVAGVGNQADAMAGAGALFADLETRLQPILSLGTVERLTLSGVDDLTLTVQPFQVATDKLVLATLSVGPGPKKDTVEKLLREMDAKR